MSQTHVMQAATNVVKIHKPSTANTAVADVQEATCAVPTAVTMTPAALAHLKQVLKARKGSVGLHLSIKTTGCSGYSYVVELIDKIKEGDHTFTVGEGVVIAVDPKSYPMVKGTVIDYVRKGLNSHFVYNNPNQAGECGCGESFSVKSD